MTYIVQLHIYLCFTTSFINLSQSLDHTTFRWAVGLIHNEGVLIFSNTVSYSKSANVFDVTLKLVWL